MGKPVSHTARIAVWVLLCAAGFGIPAVLFLSSGDAVKQEPARVTELSSAKTDVAPEQAPKLATRVAKDTELDREPAREPMSALAAPAKPAPPPDPDSLPKRWRLVHQPVATAAGVFDIEGVTIVLPGLDTVLPNETCTDASGSSWPCGMGARTAFRAYLRGRSMNCKLPDQRPDDAILGECLLQGDDPAAWLVKNGWARAKVDGPYASLESEARSAKRGIFGSRPR
jgi:endonuclease YncB( thermonuclease family)